MSVGMGTTSSSAPRAIAVPPRGGDSASLGARCWLVRHGERIDETDEYRAWVERTHPGRRFDPHLTAAGKAQAAVAAEALSGLPHTYTALYCSPQLRCIETAAPIAAAVGLKIKIVAGLSQCAAAIERAGLAKMLDRFVHRAPVAGGGTLLQSLYPELELEEHDDTVETFEGAFHRLAQRHKDENIILVTHREGIRLLGERKVGVRWATCYCCISEFRYTAPGEYVVFLPPTDPAAVREMSRAGWDGTTPTPAAKSAPAPPPPK